MRLLAAVTLLVASAVALETVQPIEPIKLPAQILESSPTGNTPTETVKVMNAPIGILGDIKNDADLTVTALKPKPVESDVASSAAAPSETSVKVVNAPTPTSFGEPTPTSSVKAETVSGPTHTPSVKVESDAPTITILTELEAQENPSVASYDIESADTPTVAASDKIEAADTETVATEVEFVTVVNNVDATVSKAGVPKETPQTGHHYTVKVVDLPPVPEIVPVRMQIPVLSMPDIRPEIVPPEVMRQVEEMAAQNKKAIHIGEAHPFAFYNSEPLDHFQAVNVVDSAVNQLDAQMDPVVVVQSEGHEHAIPQMIYMVPDAEKVLYRPRYLHNVPTNFHNHQEYEVPIGFRTLPPEARRGQGQQRFQDLPEQLSRNDVNLRSEFRPVSIEYREQMEPQGFQNAPDELSIPEGYRPLPPEVRRHPAHMLELPNEPMRDQPMDLSYRQMPQEFRRDMPQQYSIPEEYLRGPVAAKVDHDFYSKPSEDLVDQPAGVMQDFRPTAQEFRRQTLPPHYKEIPREYLRRHHPSEKPLDPQFQPYPFRMFQNPMMR